jgi:hypothetical protein
MVLRILDDFLERVLPRTCQRKSNRVSQNDRASTFRTSSEDDMAIVSPTSLGNVLYTIVGRSQGVYISMRQTLKTSNVVA